MEICQSGWTDSCGEQALHLSHSLIHLGLPGELPQLACRKLEQTDITLLGGDGSFDNVDFALGRDGLRLNLLDELQHR